MINLIQNLADLVDFTCKVTTRIKDFKESVDCKPKYFRNAQSTFPLLSKAMSHSLLQVESGSLDEESRKALQPVVQDCLTEIPDLYDIFRHTLPTRKSSKLAREWKAMLSLRQDKRIEEKLNLLHSRIPILTYYHLVTTHPGATGNLSRTLPIARIERSSTTRRMVPVPRQVLLSPSIDIRRLCCKSRLRYSHPYCTNTRWK